MDALTDPAATRVVERAARDVEVLAVILFGSRVRGDAGPASDIDVALVLTPDLSRDDAVRKRGEYLSESGVDLSVFQQLPLHIRSRVLKEGVVLFTRDEDALYDLAARTARAYEHFRRFQRLYLDEIARG